MVIKGVTVKNTSYGYYSDGLRAYKTTTSGVRHDYYYDGDRLIAETIGTDKYILYHYDETDSIYSITYNDGSSTAKYYFFKNLQGDVIEIRSSTNSKVATYKYDPWGNINSITDSSGNTITDTTHIANINPIRYRSYYYDTETGFYYLKSRYYDPAIGRFISADKPTIATDPSTVTDKNLFAYCDNDPINRYDDGGEFWLPAIAVGAVIGAAIGAVSNIAAQAVSGQSINLSEVVVSAVSGAVSGAVSAALPGMGAVTTGVVQGTVGAGTYVATELVNDRTPTVAGAVTAGVTSGVLAGGAKVVGNAAAKPKVSSNSGVPFRGVGSSQCGVDPNTLQLNPNFSPNPAKYSSAMRQIKTSGMYGTIDVARNGLVYNGQHRVFIARELGISVDVIIR